MNPERYRDLFVQEAREHLAVLVEGLVALEAGFDRERLDALFRAAHSLKGMAATLGYDDEAALAHALEDHLGHMRASEAAPEGGLGLLLDATDRLGACVDAIEAGTQRPDTGAMTSGLRSALDDGGPALVAAQRGSDVTPDAARRLLAAHDALPEGERQWLSFRLAAGCVAPRARLLVAERTAAAFGEVVATHPERGAWQHVSAAEAVVFVVRAGGDGRSIAERLAKVPDVQDVQVGRPPEAPERTAPERAPPAGSPTRTVRLDVARIDEVLDATGELRIAEAQLARLLDGVFVGRKPHELNEALERVGRETKHLQDLALSLRTLPVTLTTGRLPRLVRDLSERFGKEVRLELAGEETQVDRSVLEALNDPLVHLVKNAVDHGIEPAAERVAAGKPAMGTVRVAFRRDNAGVEVEVSDDGRGVPRDRLVEKAVALGLVDRETALAMPDRDLFRLLGTPGLSTAQAVTDVSGRGVGLDAVFTEVERLGGTCVIRSDRGAGTTVALRLPPSLAVLEALECDVDGEPYYLPVDAIVTTLAVDAEARAAGRVLLPVLGHAEDAAEDTGGAEAAEAVPLRDLAQLLGLHARPPRYAPAEATPRPSRRPTLVEDDRPLGRPGARRLVRSAAWRPDRAQAGRVASGPVGVVVERHGQSLCLLVDGVRTIREVVVKSLDVPGGARFISGATIEGDGRVGLILDVPSLIAAGSPVGRSPVARS